MLAIAIFVDWPEFHLTIHFLDAYPTASRVIPRVLYAIAGKSKIKALTSQFFAVIHWRAEF
jgi:hypothetical protein